MAEPSLAFIVPEWPAPSRVRAVSTTRQGGVSAGPYAGFNLGDHVGDDPACVAANRQLLLRALPGEPRWLKQVHGIEVVDAALAAVGTEADAAFTRRAGVVCTIMTADCLPVIFCDRAGSVVAAAHAGWRGLAGGVLEATLAAMGSAPRETIAWLGPAIGPEAFEVGDEVRHAFVSADAQAALAFRPQGEGKWLADLFLLARQRLAAAGVEAVFGGGECTLGQPEKFFSHRRDRVSGRMATLVWLD